MYCGEKFFWSVALLGTGGGIEWENVRNRTDFSVKKIFLWYTINGGNDSSYLFSEGREFRYIALHGDNRLDCICHFLFLSQLSNLA